MVWFYNVLVAKVSFLLCLPIFLFLPIVFLHYTSESCLIIQPLSFEGFLFLLADGTHYHSHSCVPTFTLHFFSFSCEFCTFFLHTDFLTLLTILLMSSLLAWSHSVCSATRLANRLRPGTVEQISLKNLPFVKVTMQNTNTDELEKGDLYDRTMSTS